MILRAMKHLHWWSITWLFMFNLIISGHKRCQFIGLGLLQKFLDNPCFHTYQEFWQPFYPIWVMKRKKDEVFLNTNIRVRWIVPFFYFVSFCFLVLHPSLPFFPEHFFLVGQMSFIVFFSWSIKLNAWLLTKFDIAWLFKVTSANFSSYFLLFLLLFNQLCLYL